MNYLFRFRSMKHILDPGYDELQGRRIFLEDSRKLNDPMEGLLNVRWKGRQAEWLNFFKHYFESLYKAVELIAITDGQHKLHSEDIVLCKNEFWDDDFINQERAQEFDASWLAFADFTSLYECTSMLERTRRSLNKNLVLQILEKFLLPALKFCPKIPLNDSLQYSRDQNKDFVENILHINIDLNKRQKEAYDASSSDGHFNDFLNTYYADHFSWNHNERFLLCNFSNIFMDKIVNLCVPVNYTASFSECFDEPLLWSHYADSNRGVCLIYNVRKDYNDRYYMLPEDLEGLDPCYLEKVSYNHKLESLDFFSMLGLLNGATIENRWRKYNNVKTAINIHYGFNKEAYREKVLQAIRQKMKNWQYEKEYRIIKNELDDNIQQSFKLIKDELFGVIFGIRASSFEKVKVSNMVKYMEKRSSRSKIKLYQAIYSERNGKIRAYEIMSNEEFIC